MSSFLTGNHYESLKKWFNKSVTKSEQWIKTKCFLFKSFIMCLFRARANTDIAFFKYPFSHEIKNNFYILLRATYMKPPTVGQMTAVEYRMYQQFGIEGWVQ